MKGLCAVPEINLSGNSILNGDSHPSLFIDHTHFRRTLEHYILDVFFIYVPVLTGGDRAISAQSKSPTRKKELHSL